MEIKLEDVIEKLQNSDDMISNSIILRLYSEYEKRSENEEEITLIKIRNAYDRIITTLHKKDNFEEYDERIVLYYIMLKNDINNFSIKDKKNIEKVIDLITYMEALLKLDITFTSGIERCLKRELKKENVNKKLR